MRKTTLLIAVTLFGTAFNQPNKEYILAGLKPGLNYDQAKSVLLSEGFTPQAGGPQKERAWLEVLDDIKKGPTGYQVQGKGTAIRKQTFLKGEGEAVTIQFQNPPTGSYLTRITYAISGSPLDEQRLLPGLIQRYGNPTVTKRQGSRVGYAWCHGYGIEACIDPDAHPLSNRLSLDGNEISLNFANGIMKSWKAQADLSIAQAQKKPLSF